MKEGHQLFNKKMLLFSECREAVKPAKRDNKFNNIQLLIDENNSLRTLWQVPTTLGFLPGRVTYVINLEGRVIATHNAFLEAEEHTDAALKALTEKKA